MIYLYDIMRVKISTGAFDWTTHPCTASVLAESYVANYATDLNINAFPVGVRYADTPVTRRQVTAAGWWTCDQITFSTAIFPGPTSRVIVWRTSDGLPLFLCQFPVLPTSDLSRPFTLLFSLSKPGILRP